ncbi:Rrf2 family transcriptional regulator [Nocardioides luteus]|uniref:Rrf2 family transcriptional regulator n=1 Tax=Nocardioides luteus TaxID=1844 RepID=UPI0018C96D71|nr:Rrf2 family transcriptional regulator [Nocardioides luteus]MBG6095398.1 Rrf2 family protein [Nocardioides luteus]
MATPTNTRFAVAVHVLTYLASCAAAGRTTPVSSDELAASTAVNPVHVRKVLGPLRTAGLVRSRPGAHGGWELAADPGVVNLAQVWQLLQGDDPVLGIHGPNPACPVGASIQGVLVDLDRRVAKAVLAELEGITLNDVLDDSGFDPADVAGLLP